EAELQRSFRLLLAGWGRQLHAVRAAVRLKDDSRVVVSPDGTIAAVLEKDQVRLLDAATGRDRGQALAHPGKVEAAAVSADARDGVTMCEEKQAHVRVWDLSGKKPTAKAFPLNPALNAKRRNPPGDWLAEPAPDGRTVLVLVRVAPPTTRSIMSYWAYLL